MPGLFLQKLPDASLNVIQVRRRLSRACGGGGFDSFQLFEYILGAADEDGPLADKPVRSFAGGTFDRSGDGEDGSALLGGVASGDQRATAVSGLDHDDGLRKSADQSVP